MSDPSESSRAWIVAMRSRIAGVIEKAVESMPRGPRIRSANTSPSRLPVMPSTTRPAQSMLEPYSHCSPGSKSRGVSIEAYEASTTHGWPCSLASLVYVSLKKSYVSPAVWVSSWRVVMSLLGARSLGDPSSPSPSRTWSPPILGTYSFAGASRSRSPCSTN